MDLDLTVDSLVLQMTALLDSQSLMDLVLIPYSQHLHLLVILTGSHSSLLDLELYLSLVDLSNLPQQTHQKIQFYLLDLVLQSRDKQTGGLDLDPCLLLVVLQIPSPSTKQQQVYLQYLVLVSRSIPNVISVLQLLLLCLVLQSREQLKIMLEILLSILYLDLLSKEKATPKLDLVPYSLQVELQNPRPAIHQKAPSSLLSVEAKQNPLLQQQKLDLVLSSLLVDLSKASPSTKQQLVFIRSVVRLYSTIPSALLVLDLYSLLAGQQNRRPPTNQKAQFCLLHLELEQKLLQSEKYLSVELYLPSLVKLLSKELQLQKKIQHYTPSVVQSSLSTESDILVLVLSIYSAVLQKQLQLQKNLQDFTSSKEARTNPSHQHLTSDLVLTVDSLEREFPRNIPKHTSESHNHMSLVVRVLLVLNTTSLVLVIYSLLVVQQNPQLQIHQKTLHSLQFLEVLVLQKLPRTLLDLVLMVDSLVHASRELHKRTKKAELSHSVVLSSSNSSTCLLLGATSSQLAVLQKELHSTHQKTLIYLSLVEAKQNLSLQQAMLDSEEQHYLVHEYPRNTPNVMSVTSLSLLTVVKQPMLDSFLTGTVVVQFTSLVMVILLEQETLLDLDLYSQQVVLQSLLQPTHQKAQFSLPLLVSR